MPKGGKSSGDYEGWLLRTLDKAEDLAFAHNAADWQNFVETKTQDYHGLGVSGGQADAIGTTLRDLALEMQEDVGIMSSVQPIRGAGGVRFRDLTGEFGRKGTWVAADKIRARVMDELDARVVAAKYLRRGAR